MKHPEGFPSKLARLRAKADMTQKDLAKAAGISVPQIGRYETGLSKPRMNALIKLANALSVDVSELQNAEDEPASVSVIFNEEGTLHPTNMPQKLFETIEMVSEKLGISLNAAMMVSIDALSASMRGDEPQIDEYIKKALHFLNEEALPKKKKK
ncbi:DNA-binding transcriptional regulator, XRE-family HTH domain [Pseudomonas saponiphila]|uniref:DNA-binding transcriptional regulator, XRE-family HTH domain n=1 Tax=Pseudomonas saponiphila TaxID=556534 RepID=A0A1H4MCS7_9PSED|nr:helix-turn-helix transcriptional regulator [Pseudomonas saponiphila]SEB80142.1 DNA-binding transcriptional regulator, XRE-family HTH domain [Pseudomonas saponiphila]